jgi:hypothetical protein
MPWKCGESTEYSGFRNGGVEWRCDACRYPYRLVTPAFEYKGVRRWQRVTVRLCKKCAKSLVTSVKKEER